MGMFVTRALGDNVDVVAPDGSEIRLLAEGQRGSLCLATLPVGTTATAVAHRSVEEIWYCVRGSGELWRRYDDQEDTTELSVGLSAVIRPGMRFQWRNTGSSPLEILIATMPPWPGASEAQPVPGRWDA
jgi:mannose-6-phosphate isomerase-like protein (cupin superfamily)